MNPVVTGLGIVSAVGMGVAANEQALRLGRSGLDRLRRFPSPRQGHLPVAEVKAFLGRGPRTLALGLPALHEAVSTAGLNAPELVAAGAGLAVGTCVGGMPETEQALAGILGGRDCEVCEVEVFSRHECGQLTHALAARAGLPGPTATLSTACSSGAQAIAHACELLAEGEAEVMLAGGVDALCRLTLNGFASLLAIDPEGCRPFDRERRGMSLGEGAAFLVLETPEHATRRGARPGAGILASVRGWANSCDAHHLTAPHPEGRGAAEAMIGAMGAASVAPGEVDYVNAHGTGTTENDRAEGLALRRVFGDRVPALSSTKGIYGHALGAAGAIEAVATVLCLEGGFLPGTVGLAQIDPECQVQPLLTTTRAQPRIALSNSFGFGGNNTVLCLARP